MKHVLLYFIILFGCLPLKGQNEVKRDPIYWNVGMGLQFGKFQDLATSPLYYQGGGPAFSIARLATSAEKEIEAGTMVATGLHQAKVGDESAQGMASRLEFYFSYLRSISRFSKGPWNIKAGASANALVNFRQNPALGNNFLGFEMINTLYGTVKVTRDISRKQGKTVRIGWLRLRRKAKHRDLSYRFNLGLMNNTYRNGYVYLNQSWLLEEQENLVENHEYRVFSGVRMGSEINLTRYLPNGNAIRWSLTSDVYKTGGDFDVLSSTQHALRFILMFNAH